MFLIDNILVSPEIFEKKFCCNLAACKGACCVEGDYGAPLLEEEVKIMKELTELVAPLVDEMGRKTLEEKGGVHFYDGMGEYGTTLRPDRACALDRKSTRLNSSHVATSYAVVCLNKKIIS